MTAPDGPDGTAPVSAATRVVGVMGYPVAHSLSPRLHNTAFAHLGIDWVSVGFPVPPGQAAMALAGARALGLCGLSVTMPHKEDVAAAVGSTTETASRLGAVNCVADDGGSWLGDNTDGAGLLAALARVGFTAEGARCLVVGAGGAARAVIAALGDAGATEVVVVNRTAARAVTSAGLAGPAGRVGAAEEAGACDLVVNATPAGMADVPGDRRAGRSIRRCCTRAAGRRSRVPPAPHALAGGGGGAGSGHPQRVGHARPPGRPADRAVDRADGARRRHVGVGRRAGGPRAPLNPRGYRPAWGAPRAGR